MHKLRQVKNGTALRVGPFGSRDAATAAQDKAKSVASCVVIGM